jgi:hypothetical protein
MAASEVVERALCALADACEAQARALRTLAAELAGADVQSPLEEFIDAGTARRCGLSPRRFREAIASGDLRGFRVGRRLLARSSDVIAYVERHAVVTRLRTRQPEPVRTGRPEPAGDLVNAKIRDLLDAGRLRVVGPR